VSECTFSSIAAADLDADGDDDLVLGATYWEELQVLMNVPVPPTITPPDWFTNIPGRVWEVDMSLNGETDPVPSMGKVLCANFFNEWTDDELPLPSFAIALPGPNGLRLMPQFESTLYQDPSTPQGVETQNDFWEGSYTTASRIGSPTCATPPSPGTRSHWTVTLGNGWGLTNATHLQMIVGTSTSDVEPLYYMESTTQLNGAVGSIAEEVIGFDGLEDYNDDEDSIVRYFVQVRPVRKNASGEVVRVWRWSILGMCATCDGFLWLMSLPGSPTEPVNVYFETCDYDPSPLCPFPIQGGQPLSTRYVPSAVPQSRIPGPGPGVFEMGSDDD
jgi:hypothetical protein